tara:strand:- start:39 stop:1307 length:1269 start_codon:yes stop_codon:yes gene_type:complete
MNRLKIISWCFYDFGNSAFTTLVVTFIYSTYFTKSIAENEIDGTFLWSNGIAISAIIVALFSPLLGAIADKAGYRKQLLVITTLSSILATTLLFFPHEGQVLFSLALFVIANVNFELGSVFYNSYLPEIANKEKIGRISGYGWGLGYCGGLICMLIAMLVFISPNDPWFGFSKDTGSNIRATNLLVGIWFLLFSLPAIFFLDDNRVFERKNFFSLLSTSIEELKTTFNEIRNYKNTVRFLIARLIYNDGLITIFAFGAVYAAGTFDFTFNEIMIFGIILNVAAGLGALTMGHLDDILGGKRTIQISLIGLMFATTLAVFTESKSLFWLSGIIIGLFAGPNQSASRSFMGRLTPKGKINEFYGFFAFSGKFTSFLGPLILGLLTKYFSSQRMGVSVVFFFFFIGLILMSRVKEPKRLVDSKHN